MANLDYIGKGMKHPIAVQGGTTVITSGDDLLKQSILRILTTPVGTTFFLPEFGSRVQEVLFIHNDVIMQALLTTFIKEALAKWETRIEVISVEYSGTEETLFANITYRVLNSNEIDSFVYPFYTTIEA